MQEHVGQVWTVADIKVLNWFSVISRFAPGNTNVVAEVAKMSNQIGQRTSELGLNQVRHK